MGGKILELISIATEVQKQNKYKIEDVYFYIQENDLT